MLCKYAVLSRVYIISTLLGCLGTEHSVASNCQVVMKKVIEVDVYKQSNNQDLDYFLPTNFIDGYDS